MTEKRFERIYADVDVFCKDHNAKGISQLIEKEDYDKIVELLNQLNDENEQLKQQLRIFEEGLKSEIRETKTAMEDWNECLDDCRKLKEENEQLKSENRLLKGRIQEYEEIIGELNG